MIAQQHVQVKSQYNSGLDIDGDSLASQCKKKIFKLSTKPKSSSSAVRHKNTMFPIQPVFLSKYLRFILCSENQWKGKQSETAISQMKYGTKVHLGSGWSLFCSRCAWQRKVVLLLEAWTAWTTLTEASLSRSARERLLPQLGYKKTSVKLREHLVAKWSVRPQMWSMIFFSDFALWSIQTISSIPNVFLFMCSQTGSQAGRGEEHIQTDVCTHVKALQTICLCSPLRL